MNNTVTIYAYATGFFRDNNGTPIMIATECTKEKYEEQCRINWQTAYKYEVASEEQATRIRKRMACTNYEDLIKVCKELENE